MNNWYEFDQNNSGGSFVTNDKLCHRLFIEADSEQEAKSIAEGLGVYFDGVSEGMDCECCGDRWCPPWGEVKLPQELKSWPRPAQPAIVATTIEEFAQWYADEWPWTSPDCRIFYKDGTVKEIYSKKDKNKNNERTEDSSSGSKGPE